MSFVSLEMALIFTKRDLQLPKQSQILKSEKYEAFCGSKLLIWQQKWAGGVWYGNSLVVCRVLPGRIILSYFEQDMRFLVK